MIVTISGDPYSPDVTDVHLPQKYREFGECAVCGRAAMDDCWAMAAMMEYDNQAVTEHTHLACVYCATYQAIAEFLRPDWCKILQIQVMPDSGIMHSLCCYTPHTYVTALLTLVLNTKR